MLKNLTKGKMVEYIILLIALVAFGLSIAAVSTGCVSHFTGTCQDHGDGKCPSGIKGKKSCHDYTDCPMDCYCDTSGGNPPSPTGRFCNKNEDCISVHDSCVHNKCTPGCIETGEQCTPFVHDNCCDEDDSCVCEGGRTCKKDEKGTCNTKTTPPHHNSNTQNTKTHHVKHHNSNTQNTKTQHHSNSTNKSVPSSPLCPVGKTFCKPLNKCLDVGDNSCVPSDPPKKHNNLPLIIGSSVGGFLLLLVLIFLLMRK